MAKMTYINELKYEKLSFGLKLKDSLLNSDTKEELIELFSNPRVRSMKKTIPLGEDLMRVIYTKITPKYSIIKLDYVDIEHEYYKEGKLSDFESALNIINRSEII